MLHQPCENFSVNGLQAICICIAGRLQIRVEDKVAGPWFVQRINSDYKGVVPEVEDHSVPERDKFTRHVVHIVPQCVKALLHLRRVKVVTEVLFLAVSDQVVTIVVDLVAFGAHVIADIAELGVVVVQNRVCELVDTTWVFSDDFLSVEVRNAFATHEPRKSVFVRVNQGVNTGFAKVVDKLLNLLEVIPVIYARFCFHSFPHDPKSNEVEAPLFQVCDILCC